jgi:hypothetical protein
MEDAYIEPASLAAISRRHLFYPASGFDWNEIILRFVDHVDGFHFCDCNEYLDLEKLALEPLFEDPGAYRCVDRRIEGSPKAEKRSPTVDHNHFELERGFLVEVFERVADGRQFRVIRRRGFGQCALAEFSEASIGVFVHRGDSPGEGGSNAYFLGNRKRSYEPLSNLFDKLALKLCNPALVVSDGSNADAAFLKAFHHQKISGAQAFDILRNEPHARWRSDWRCVGYIGSRNGPTIIWRVERH